MRTLIDSWQSVCSVPRSRGRVFIRLTIVSFVLVCCPVTADMSYGDDPQNDAFQVDILKLRVQSSSSRTLSRLSGRVDLYLRLTNRSDATQQMKSYRFRLQYDKKVSETQRRRGEPLLDASATIAPAEAREGWISFKVSHSSSNEIPLVLKCAIDSTQAQVDLNRELRRLINLRVRQIGHEQRLALVEIDRTIDLPTVWILDAKLRELKTQSIDRVVVSANDPDQTRLSRGVTQWLQLASRRIEVPQRRLNTGYPPPVQFAEFHLSGFQYGGRQLGRIMHKSTSLAVAAAVESLYERLPTAEAMKALNSPEEGLRRAALASCIDRLPEDELRRILEKTTSGTEESRQLILEMLDRVSSPLAVAMLCDTVLNSFGSAPLASDSVRPDTVEIAARTLVRCIGPSTDDALAAVWRASAGSWLRDTLVHEIMETRDHRWLWMVQEFATEQLERYSVDPTESADEADTPKMAVSPQLKKALQFVHSNDGTFVAEARRFLLSVTAPQIQDVLLEIVAESPEVSDANLAARCISERLENGQLTTELINVIRQAPDSRWTQRLMELHQSGKRVPGKTPALMAAIYCANAEQLQSIIEQYDELKRLRPQLLQQLIAMGHPQAGQIFKRALEGTSTEVNVAVKQDLLTATPEMLQLVLDRYEVYRLAAIEHGKLATPDKHVARQLLSRLGRLDHPEARRMVNLSLVSPVEVLREVAGEQQYQPRQAAQLRRNGIDPWSLRNEGKYREALELVNQLIARDPLDPNTLLLRASLNLRSNEVEAGLKDIQEANRLSPGDVFTESTLALAQVRLGQIEVAVNAAEATLGRIPESVGSYYWWTQYNTACVYGRALERPELTEHQKSAFTRRAIELLQDACQTGIDDHAHMVKDPDLVVFHDHPEWDDILQDVKKNEQAKKRFRRN